MLACNFLLFCVVLICSQVCNSLKCFPLRLKSKISVSMADVEITFPNNKKTKAAAGSSLKDAAKKAGFTPNYGCEEGKCGSCELKFSGKKIRPCIGKVPASATPIKLDNP